MFLNERGQAVKFEAIKGLIGAVAPTLGQALGGPLGGAAAQTIASVLGCKPDEKSIANAVQAATPEQLAEIKKAELDFQVQMKKLDVDVFALEAEDVQHARLAFKGDWTPKFIAVACVFSSEVTSLWSRYKTLLRMMTGLLILSLGIWVESSHLSSVSTTAHHISTTND
jgi:hypothetical protein